MKNQIWHNFDKMSSPSAGCFITATFQSAQFIMAFYTAIYLASTKDVGSNAVCGFFVLFSFCIIFGAMAHFLSPVSLNYFVTVHPTTMVQDPEESSDDEAPVEEDGSDYENEDILSSDSETEDKVKTE
jgi:hypothetical protein